MLNDNYFYLTIYIMTNSNNAMHRKKTHDKKIKTHRQYKKKHNINKKTRRAYKKIGTQILSRKNNRHEGGGNNIIKALLAAAAVSSATANGAAYGQGSGTTFEPFSGQGHTFHDPPASAPASAPAPAPPAAADDANDIICTRRNHCGTRAELRALYNKLVKEKGNLEGLEEFGDFQDIGVGHDPSSEEFDALYPELAKNLYSNRRPPDEVKFAEDKLTKTRTEKDERTSDMKSLIGQEMELNKKIAEHNQIFNQRLKTLKPEEIDAEVAAGTIRKSPDVVVDTRVYDGVEDKVGRIEKLTLKGGYELNSQEYLDLIKNKNDVHSKISQQRQAIDKLGKIKTQLLLYLRNGLSPQETKKYDDEFGEYMKQKNTDFESSDQECTRLESELENAKKTDKSHMTPEELAAQAQRLKVLVEEVNEAREKREQSRSILEDGQKIIIKQQDAAQRRGDTANAQSLNNLLVDAGGQSFFRATARRLTGRNQYGILTEEARGLQAAAQMMQWVSTNLFNVDPGSRLGKDIHAFRDLTNMAPGAVLDITNMLGGALAASATACGASSIAALFPPITGAAVPVAGMECTKLAAGLAMASAVAYYRYLPESEKWSATLDLGGRLAVDHLKKEIEEKNIIWQKVRDNPATKDEAIRLKEEIKWLTKDLEHVVETLDKYKDKMTDFTSTETHVRLFSPLNSLFDTIIANMNNADYLRTHSDFLATQIRRQRERETAINNEIEGIISNLPRRDEFTPEVIADLKKMLKSQGEKVTVLTETDALKTSVDMVLQDITDLHAAIVASISTDRSTPFYSPDGYYASGRNNDEKILNLIEASELYSKFFGAVRPSDMKQRQANAYILGNSKLKELFKTYKDKLDTKVNEDTQAVFAGFKKYAEDLKQNIKDRPVRAAEETRKSQKAEVNGFIDKVYDNVTYAAVTGIKKMAAIFIDIISQLEPPQEIREATTYALNNLVDKLSIIAPSRIAFNYLIFFGLLAIFMNSYMVPFGKYNLDKLRGVAGGVWREEPSVLTAMHDNAVKYGWIPDNLHTRRQALKEMVSIVDENGGEDANKKLEKVGLKADASHIRTLAQELINAQVKIIQTQHALKVSYDEYITKKDEATRATFLDKNTDWNNANKRYDDALKQIERLLTGEDVGNVSQQMNTFRDKTEDKHTKALTFCQKVEITNEARKASSSQKGGSLEDDHPKLKPTIQFIKEATQSFNNMKRLFEDKQPEPVSKDMETIFNITIKKVIFYVQVIIYNSTKTLNLPKDLLSLIMFSDYMRDLLESIYLLMTDIIHEVIVLNNILKSDIKDTLYATIYQKIFTHLFYIMEHHNIVFDETNYSFTKGYHLINIPNSSDNSDWLNDFKETNIRIVENIGFSESQKSFDKAIEYLNIYNKLSGIDPPPLEYDPLSSEDDPPPLEEGSSEKPDIAGLLEEVPSKFGGSTISTSKSRKKYKNPRTPKKYKLNKQHFSNSKKKIKKHKNFFNTSLKKTKYNK